MTRRYVPFGRSLPTLRHSPCPNWGMVFPGDDQPERVSVCTVRPWLAASGKTRLQAVRRLRNVAFFNWTKCEKRVPELVLPPDLLKGRAVFRLWTFRGKRATQPKWTRTGTRRGKLHGFNPKNRGL